MWKWLVRIGLLILLFRKKLNMLKQNSPSFAKIVRLIIVQRVEMIETNNKNGVWKKAAFRALRADCGVDWGRSPNYSSNW